MPRQIIITFEEPVDIHKMRNFGETLHHACKNDGWPSDACPVGRDPPMRMTGLAASIAAYSAIRLASLPIVIGCRLIPENPRGRRRLPHPRSSTFARRAWPAHPGRSLPSTRLFRGILGGIVFHFNGIHYSVERLDVLRDRRSK